ncbi:probable 2-oxoglutarate-dependent dioxygenase AOP1 [Coffea eugenioides]|uniref:probable 2-oxoglutarate-dependent dioxygenase AOP1 n=1 Tax=Coffea eugenioides TaxID=49369 RepID=UPI000F6141A9|nr:probable 2-oxoglutarate-dependent dioxygenase AOP1 [Coffea eugenioides]
MGSVTRQNQLPVVDFTGETLNPSSTRWLSTREEIVRALEEYGCFIANYDKVSLELHQAIFLASQELFELPTETKVLNTSDSPSHGYMAHRRIPLLEALGIENATTVDGVQRFTNILWPNGNNHFSETALSYSKLVAELNHVVMRMVAETYGVEKDCESLLGSIYYLLRLIKYRAPREDESNVGLFPHADQTFMSILHQAQVNGLEIMTKNGDWMLIDSLSPSSFIVMAGDVCMAWTNGRIEPPLHRVTIMSGSEERYSLSLFAFMRDVMVQVPEKLVDDEHPLQYKPFDPFKYLLFCVTEEGQKSKCQIKSYCGV